MSRGPRSTSTDRTPAHGHRARRPDHVATGESEQHPLLSLQQTAGNRAVQRLVGSGSSRPAAIQRVLSPATHGYGMAALGGLLASWSGLVGETAGLQGSAANANAQTLGMMANIGEMQAFIGMAQAEPAPQTEYGEEPLFRGDRTRATP